MDASPADSNAMLAQMKSIFAATLLVSIQAITFFGANAQPLPSKETQIKAVFLYNFTQFAKWPDDKFAHPSAPLVIGILGEDPFGPFLDQIVKGETVNGHPIEIRRLTAPEQARTCHIVFVEESQSDHLSEIIQILSGQNVITVSDLEDFTRHGGMIKFFLEDNKVRFEVNMKKYKSTEVVLSSRLLRLARICCN